MSIKTMIKVWDDSKAKGTQLNLMLALADFSDDDGFCWPSLQKLQDRTRSSRPTVCKHLDRCIANGELLTFATYGEDGRQTSNRYILRIGFSDQETIKTIHKKIGLPLAESQKMLAIQVKAAKKKLEESKVKKGDEGLTHIYPPCKDGFTPPVNTGLQNPSVNHQLPPIVSDEKNSSDRHTGNGNLETLGEKKKKDVFDDLFPDVPPQEEKPKERMSQWDVLMSGRVGEGEKEVEAEKELMDSGWEIRVRSVRQAMVLFLSYTRFNVPNSDGERKRYFKALRTMADEYTSDELRRYLPQVEKMYVEKSFTPSGPEAYIRPLAGLRGEEAVKSEEEIFTHTPADAVPSFGDIPLTGLGSQESTELEEELFTHTPADAVPGFGDIEL